MCNIDIRKTCIRMRVKNLPKKNKKEKLDIKRMLTAALELPKEIALNLPVISIIGAEEVGIENYKTIIEYSAEQVRIMVVSHSPNLWT